MSEIIYLVLNADDSETIADIERRVGVQFMRSSEPPVCIYHARVNTIWIPIIRTRLELKPDSEFTLMTDDETTGLLLSYHPRAQDRLKTLQIKHDARDPGRYLL